MWRIKTSASVVTKAISNCYQKKRHYNLVISKIYLGFQLSGLWDRLDKKHDQMSEFSYIVKLH